MSNHSEITKLDAVDREALGEQTWDEVQRLFVEWANAVGIGAALDAERAEDEFRLVALAYASLAADGEIVTTGRKAIVRSIVSRLGGPRCADVSAMLDAVIAGEEAAAMRDTPRVRIG